MGAIRGNFESAELKALDDFLVRKAVTLAVTDDPEERRRYFCFRTQVRRITGRMRGEFVGGHVCGVPIYDIVPLKCSMSFAWEELHGRTRADLIDELKAFATKEFHLDEEKFQVGRYEYIH